MFFFCFFFSDEFYVHIRVSTEQNTEQASNIFLFTYPKPFELQNVAENESPWFSFSNTSSTISKEKINWTQILFIKGLKNCRSTCLYQNLKSYLSPPNTTAAFNPVNLPSC